jgi:hypothetical protein
MAAYLKHSEKQLYLKAIDKQNDKLEFTENVAEAKPYDNDWFAKAELEFIQFHYPDYKEEYLDHLVPWYQ